MAEDRLYDSLPEEPALAFLQLEAKYAQELNDFLAQADRDSNYRYEYSKFMARVVAAAREYNIEEFSDFVLPAIDDAYQVISEFQLGVSGVSATAWTQRRG